MLHILSKTYNRVCCYSVVPTPSISETPNRKVQRSAAHFVKNDFSYHSNVTTMLKHLKWPLLEHRRNFLKLIMYVYKILHGLVDISFTLILLSTPTRGHNQHFVTPFTRTDTYLNYFLPSAINLWNSLPNSLFELDDLNQFKDDLSLYLFPTNWFYVWLSVCLYSFCEFYTVTITIITQPVSQLRDRFLWIKKY